MSTALTPQPEMIRLLGELEGAGVVTLTDLRLDPHTSIDRWEAIGTYLRTLRDCSAWWIGSWAAWGEQMYGDAYYQVAEQTGLDRDTIESYASVCRRIEPKRRRAELSFAHHRAVTKLEPRQQDKMLKQAIRKGWSSRDLRDAVRAIDAPQPDNNGHVLPAANPDALEQVARDIVTASPRHIDRQHYLVSNEHMARLRAALGLDT